MDKVTGAEVIPTNGATPLEATGSGARTVTGPTAGRGEAGAAEVAVMGSARVGARAGVCSSEMAGGRIGGPGTVFEAEPSPGPSTRHTPQANTPTSANSSIFGARARRGCARDDSVRDFEAMDPDQTFGSDVDQRSAPVVIPLFRPTTPRRSANAPLELDLGSAPQESIDHQRNETDDHPTPEG